MINNTANRQNHSQSVRGLFVLFHTRPFQWPRLMIRMCEGHKEDGNSDGKFYHALITSSQEYILRSCARDEFHHLPLEPCHAAGPGTCLHHPHSLMLQS